jgi:hypothetical protein
VRFYYPNLVNVRNGTTLRFRGDEDAFGIFVVGTRGGLEPFGNTNEEVVENVAGANTSE